MICRILATSAIVIAVAGCSLFSSSTTDSGIVTTLNRIANTGTADLTSQIAVANAATPQDVDGAACATGALTVAAAMQKVLAATGKSAGMFTAAEVATLYQPGSDQFNWAVKTLETACIAKVHDVNQAVNSTAGIIAALPSVLALAAVPSGA
jgi:hypothetical protein